MPKHFHNAPDLCELCNTAIPLEMYDARLGPTSPAPGRWACMCRACFVLHGVGTGIGRGQHYRRADKDEAFQLQA